MIRSLTFSLLLLLPLLFAAAIALPVELWCVAKNNAGDGTLQAALDWACGQGGADCAAIAPSGPCYAGSDLQDLASYAFNDYFLKHNLTQASCDFSNTAALTSLNPSYGGCTFPSSFSVKNGSPGVPGMEPTTMDFSGGNQIAGGRWGWACMTIPLFFTLTIRIERL